MATIYFNRQHRKDYISFALLSGVLFCLPVWYYLDRANYEEGWVVYLGSGLFMFGILLYCTRLSRRKPEYQNTWTMIVAGHIAVFAGVLVCVILSLLLCMVYIPGFLTSHSASSFLDNAPLSLDDKNAGTVFQVFVPAVMGNSGVGSFMAIVVPYALRKKKTKDMSLLQEAVEQLS